MATQKTPIMTEKATVLSGIQPSGSLHIGNYFGALRPWVLNQEKHRNFFCIVDMHAITAFQDPQELHHNTRQLAAIYLAAGLEPEKSVIFVQSHVRAHVELGWLLTCVTPMGWLNRMTQFKDKASKREADSVSAGLFMYPTLMAADILAYQADFVPVGDDQRQHLEITRDIAQRFNNLYGETFKLPQALIGHTGAGARIMGLDDPTEKMSKSIDRPGHAVRLLDPPEAIKRAVMRATTDSGSAVDVLQAGPGVANLVEIYRSMTGENLETAAIKLNGLRYGELKSKVAELLVETLRPVQEKFHKLMSDQAHLDSLLKEGAERASAVAERTAKLAKERMGLG